MISLRYRRVPRWVEWLCSDDVSCSGSSSSISSLTHSPSYHRDQLEAANDFARNLWAPRNDESSLLDDMSYEDKPVVAVDEDDEEDDGKFDFFPAPEVADDSSIVVEGSSLVSHTEIPQPPTKRVEHQPPAQVVDNNGRRLLYKIDEQEEDDAFEASFVRMVDEMRRDLGADTDDEDDSTEDMLVDLSFAEEKANKRARRNGMFLQYGYF
ncbi:hypothetical protein AAF712_000036 [Marasmius tenuissimus]|uniref:Uncharacterized protein n=1 Tax=Marasmius tenuissimus TaxID=585030 RepID=A0ABR3AG39_9AGAR